MLIARSCVFFPDQFITTKLCDLFQAGILVKGKAGRKARKELKTRSKKVKGTAKAKVSLGKKKK